MTQGQLAHAVGVSLRTVGNWERGDTVPMNRAAAIERVLANYLHEDVPDASPRLALASDAELLAEIARRFDRERGRGEGAVPAGFDPVSPRFYRRHKDGLLVWANPGVPPVRDQAMAEREVHEYQTQLERAELDTNVREFPRRDDARAVANEDDTLEQISEDQQQEP
ncbi:helix-turn-helix domain-containing protein [Cellulosimicrobium terreum]|nr:helix-turn-helix domain-containing protein [Cellulosimicrobium terreum]